MSVCAKIKLIDSDSRKCRNGYIIIQITTGIIENEILLRSHNRAPHLNQKRETLFDDNAWKPFRSSRVI